MYGTDIDLRGVAKVEEMSEPEFTYYAVNAAVSMYGFLFKKIGASLHWVLNHIQYLEN